MTGTYTTLDAKAYHEGIDAERKRILDGGSEDFVTIPVKIHNSEEWTEMKVSPEDYYYLSQRNWYRNADGYARTHSHSVGRKVVHTSAHRIILGIQLGDKRKADHINGDRLDNRRSNLRVCNDSQSAKNRGGQKNNTSGQKGVYWVKKDKKWRASIKSNGVQYYLGQYKNLEDAIAVRLEAEKKYFGEYRRGYLGNRLKQ